MCGSGDELRMFMLDGPMVDWAWKRLEARGLEDDDIPGSRRQHLQWRSLVRVVAHHVFHHLEKHTQETPMRYIIWRLAGNDGKESIEFKSDELAVYEVSARSGR